ncbi:MULTISPECIES: hypothetical protein [unclassified Micromonospora]|uniref:hypothetical protein n=1 Tax=unclassified Micromonospora TaxID=2617518 RepID=UPI003A8C64E9
MIPALAETVLLLADPQSIGDHYLVVDGSVEYVLDGEAAELTQLLRSLDGGTDLATLLAKRGRPPHDVPRRAD